MKNFIVVILLLISVMSFAKEGGNGGYAYVCRDSVGNIKTARLLDLWEPETYSTYRSDEEVNVQIEKALQKVKMFFPYGHNRLKEQIQKDLDRTFFTTKNLPLTNDAFPRYAPNKGCNYEQVARYGYNIELDKVVLEINSLIYNHPSFSNTDRAALYVHEALYGLSYLDTSDQVRPVVGKIFSDSQLSKKDKDFIALKLAGSNQIMKINQEDVQRGHEFDLILQMETRAASDLRNFVNSARGREVSCEVNLTQNGVVIASVKIKDTIKKSISYYEVSEKISLTFPQLNQITIETTCSKLHQDYKWSPSRISIIYLGRNGSKTDGAYRGVGEFKDFKTVAYPVQY